MEGKEEGEVEGRDGSKGKVEGCEQEGCGKRGEEVKVRRRERRRGKGWKGGERDGREGEGKGMEGRGRGLTKRKEI